jgi:hypothetical protein
MTKDRMTKHSPVQPTTELKIGGQTYLLLFDFDAIDTAEQLSGRPLLTGLSQKDFESPSIALIRLMLFACAKATHPEITLQIAKSLVTKHNFRAVWSSVLAAWVKGLSEPDPNEEKSADPTPGQSEPPNSVG